MWAYSLPMRNDFPPTARNLFYVTMFKMVVIMLIVATVLGLSDMHGAFCDFMIGGA